MYTKSSLFLILSLLIFTFGAYKSMIPAKTPLINVYTDDAPKAIGPYVQGKIVPANSKIFYSSGQIGLDPKTMVMVSDDVGDQTVQIMKSMTALLTAAGTTWDNVIKCLIFLEDMSYFDTINKIYAGYFVGDDKPARSAIAIKGLPKDAKIEIECIAYVPPN